MSYLLDTHCHIDQYSNPELVIRALDYTNIITIAVTNAPSYFERMYKKYSHEKHLRLALGIHPLFADKIIDLEWSIFKRCLPLTRFISEVGLDFSSIGIGTKDKQIRVFNRILDLVKGSDKILSIHSRQAEAEVLDLLQKHLASPAIFHWYSGNLTTLDALISKGHYCSINPAMINSQKGKKIIERIPKSKILVETDGPHVKTRINLPVTPLEINQVYNYLSKLWGGTVETTCDQVYSNFLALLSS